MMLDTPVIRQRLFSAKAPDGSSLCLAFLLDGGCAILRDEQVIEVFDDSERAIDRALEHFLTIAKVTHGQ